MSAGERPHHLWLWFADQGSWQSAGVGTADEMRTAADIIQRHRILAGRDPLAIEVTVDTPDTPETSDAAADPDAAALIADRARAAAAGWLASIGDSTEDPVYLAFAASTYAVAAEMHAFRVALVDELRAIRREIRR